MLLYWNADNAGIEDSRGILKWCIREDLLDPLDPRSIFHS
jgi:hypothetical protein